jgi:translation initiation factor 4G
MKTEHEQVKLHKAASAWCMQKDAPPKHRLIPRKTQGILNKLTQDQFEVLRAKLLELEIDTAELLSTIIQLIYNKAVQEPLYRSTYARLCRSLSDRFPELEWETEEQKEPATFLGLLLELCQAEFAKFRGMHHNGATTTFTSEQRRQMLGNIDFFGELFNSGVLSGADIQDCMQSLLDPVLPTEYELEIACRLFSTIGRRIDNARNAQFVNESFARIAALIQTPGISTRSRFMLQDLIELRVNHWLHVSMRVTMIAKDLPRGASEKRP